MSRTTIPLIALALGLVLQTSAAGTEQPAAAGKGKDSLAPASRPETDAGANDPADFPRPAGLVRKSYSQAAGKLRDTEIATYHAGAGMDEVAGTYLERLQTAGWKKGSDAVSGSDIHRLRIIEWTMPGKEAELRFYAVKGSGSDLRVRIFTYKTVTKAGVADTGPVTATPAQASAVKAADKSKVTGAAPLGPPPTSFSVNSFNPYSHNLTWAATSWTSFNLYRRDASGETLVAEKINATGMIDHAYLAPNTVYRLVVHHVDGSDGSLEYTYANPPQPGVVSNLKAVQTGPNKVKLTWDRVQPVVNGVTVEETYQVTSPTTAAINKRLDVNSLEVTGVPLGNHWARVAMVYGDSGNMAPAPKDAAVNFDVLTDRGRYRVTFLGVECVHETADDPLQLDGKRDEIFAGAYVATVPRNNGPAQPVATLRTKVMGDTNGFADRIRAGTASDKGGIQSGDFVPDSTITTPNIGVKGTSDRFPLAVWEGELVDSGDLVAIAPVVFEWDNADEGPWNEWVGWWTTPRGAPNLANSARNPFKPEMLGTWLTVEDHRPPDKDGYAMPVHYGQLFSASGTRPIGLADETTGSAAVTGPAVLAWEPWGWVLSRLNVEKALGTQNAVVVPFHIDDPQFTSASLEGHYTLYIQIERLATPPPPVAPSGGGATLTVPKPELATANPAMVNQVRTAGISKASGAAPVGPPPTNLQVFSNGPVAHEVSWTADKWSSFDVYRIDSAGRTQIAANLNATKVTDHVYLEAHTTYRVDVHHTDGSIGSAEYDYAKPPVPETPTGFRAVQTGPGAVRLSWVTIQYINGYQLYGPTLPPEGRFISSGYQTDLTGLPLGDHEFRLAAVYSGDGKLYPAPNQAKATVTVKRVADRYRITLLGVECVHETSDDLLQVDGKRDEIFAGACVAALPDDGPLSLIGTVRSKVMGDTNAFPDRLQAGTASDKGGIQTGDFVPDATITTVKRGVTGTTDRFPLQLWEGVLSDTGGMVIVAPILFEWDKNDEAPWNEWTAWWSSDEAKTQAPQQARIDYIDKHWDMVLTKTYTETDSANATYTAHLGLGYHDSGSNRPVGVEDQANIKGEAGFFLPQLVYVPKGLCLSHAKVEAALGNQDTLLIKWLADDGPCNSAKLEGAYTLYIQIERLAPPKQAPAKLH